MALSKLDIMPLEYVIQGTRIVSLETFFDEISCVLVPDVKWGET